MEDPIRELGELLSEIGTRISINRTRVAPSTLYDANYHVVMIACAFTLHAKRDKTGDLSISEPHLRILQFIAARPILLPRVRTWLSGRKRRRLDLISQMPRGYVGDRAHGRSVEYLIALEALLRKNGDHLVTGTRFDYLAKVAKIVDRENMFEEERHVLAELKELNIPRTALEGK